MYNKDLRYRKPQETKMIRWLNYYSFLTGPKTIMQKGGKGELTAQKFTTRKPKTIWKGKYSKIHKKRQNLSTNNTLLSVTR